MMRIIMLKAPQQIASHADVFRGARFSSLCGEGRKTSSPKNADVGGYSTNESVKYYCACLRRLKV